MNNKKIVIFGAGIAGLSTAHYLINRGYDVEVIESLNVPGGLSRSERFNGDIPSEYSWRGFGPWYNNIFDLMKEIPMYLNGTKSNVYDSGLSKTGLDFNPISDKTNKNKNIVSSMDRVKLLYLLIKSICASNERSRNVYAYQNTYQELKKYLTPKGAHNLSWIFGPYIGSDASRVSVHHTSNFFSKNMFPCNGKKFNEAWKVSSKPTNEAWFDPWTNYLKKKGVKFYFGHSLSKFEFNNKEITKAIVDNNGTLYDLIADYYILAINPYITQQILQKTPELVLSDKQLQLFKPLTSDEPHIQISFYLAFDEKIVMLQGNKAITLLDSEFDITFYAQSQYFLQNTSIGKGIKSLWSGTATLDSNPGELYNLPMKKLTKQQFINEVLHQIYKSKELNKIVMKTNGKPLKSYNIKIDVWHAWIFAKNKDNVTSVEPKWVNNSRNLKYQPTSKTSIKNLYLAGAHTKTSADLYSMEAAVESGRRVADYISKMNTVILQKKPVLLQFIKNIDYVLYSINCANVVDVILIIGIIFIILYLIK